MRRLLSGCAVAALASCAAAPLSLEPRFQPGDQRTYLLISDVETSYNLPALHKTERTHLEATAQVLVESPTRVRATVTPLRFSSGTRSSEPPPPQQATLTVGGGGRVESVSGASPPLGGSKDELGALLGATGRRRVHLGDRWSERLSGGGKKSASVGAIQYLGELRIAVISTTSEAPATRERSSAQGTLALKGIETSYSETSFGIDLGYPVRLDASTEGRFTVEGAAGGGAVTIRSHTTVTLRSHTRDIGGATSGAKSPPASGTATISPMETVTATRNPARTDSPHQSPP
ncbi:MAG: hypothetical protein NVSMB57_02730 [Actinomycetota bacterium]